MSHFSALKTQICEEEHLVQALEDLGYTVESGVIRGFRGIEKAVDIKVPSGTSGYDIGFVREGKRYDIVADWWGINAIRQQAFFEKVTQQYAYRATRAKLEKQGFDVIQDERQPDGAIRMVLRRVA